MPITKDRHAHLALLEDPYTREIERVHQWASRAAADAAAIRRRDFKRDLRANLTPDPPPSQHWLAKAWRALSNLL